MSSDFSVNGSNSVNNSQPSGFKKFMNPESYAINSIFGGEGDEKFKSYLNPLCPYSEDPEGNKVSTWVDPLMKTIDANIQGDETHFSKLNPIYETFCTDDSFGEKARSWIDPGMACATSFIKDEKAAKIVYTVFNPVGGLIANTLDLFSKDDNKA